jgi:Ca2+-binding RTX toxin-like protein
MSTKSFVRNVTYNVIEIMISTGNDFELFPLGAEISSPSWDKTKSTIGSRVIPISDNQVLMATDWSREFNSTVTFLYNADTTPPTISISSNDSTLTLGETTTISFNLSEPSSDFELADVTALGGTLTNFSGSGSSYTALFTPTSNSSSNAVVSVISGKFTDESGNANTASSTLSIAVDTISPTIALSTNDSTLTVGETATISFNLSETSSDFELADVTASGGTLSNFSGSGISYTALFTPTPNSTTNAVVSVTSSKFTDAAGNNNTASNSVTMTVNTVLANSNNAPTAKTATLAAKKATEGSAFSYTLDSKQFSDADKDALTISATLQDNSTIPSWLTFNPTTKKLTGTPGYAAADTSSITIKFTADDGRGGTTFSTMVLNISNKATITGTSKADTIISGAGNDTINGGLGSDTLTGGLGNDTFVFNTKLGPANIDTITDFTSGDKISLSGSIFSKLKGDKDLFDNFYVQTIVGISTQDTNDYLFYDFESGRLYYDADGSGTKSKPIEVAIIGTGGISLTANDFSIV